MMCEDPTMRPSRTYLEMGMAVGHDKDARSSSYLNQLVAFGTPHALVVMSAPTETQRDANGASGSRGQMSRVQCHHSWELRGVTFLQPASKILIYAIG